MSGNIVHSILLQYTCNKAADILAKGSTLPQTYASMAYDEAKSVIKINERINRQKNTLVTRKIMLTITWQGRINDHFIAQPRHNTCEVWFFQQTQDLPDQHVQCVATVGWQDNICCKSVQHIRCRDTDVTNAYIRSKETIWGSTFSNSRPPITITINI